MSYNKYNYGGILARLREENFDTDDNDDDWFVNIKLAFEEEYEWMGF